MATVPVTRTWVAGEVVLASHFNTNIRDVLNYLLAPPTLQVYQGSAQSISNAAFTALTFGNEEVDNSGMHSTSVNTSRATSVYPGYYKFAGCYGASANGTGGRIAGWYKNAVAITAGEAVTANAGVGFNNCQVARTRTIFLNVGDYVELMAYQNSGGSLNTATSGAASDMSADWESN